MNSPTRSHVPLGRQLPRAADSNRPVGLGAVQALDSRWIDRPRSRTTFAPLILAGHSAGGITVQERRQARTPVAPQVSRPGIDFRAAGQAERFGAFAPGFDVESRPSVAPNLPAVPPGCAARCPYQLRIPVLFFGKTAAAVVDGGVIVTRRARTAGGVIQRLLDVVWFVLLVGGAVVVVVVVVVLARGGRPRVDFPVALVVRDGSVGHGATGSASIMGAGGQLSVKVPAEVVVVALGFAAAGLGLVLLVLRQLRALLAEAVAGSPFGARSAGRVRLIGAAIITAELTRALVVLVGSLWARAHVHIPGLAFKATFPVRIAGLGAGVLVMLLAEVFRLGAVLQRDHDLTA